MFSSTEKKISSSATFLAENINEYIHLRQSIIQNYFESKQIFLENDDDDDDGQQDLSQNVLKQIAFGKVLSIVRELLPSKDVYLFNEQYVIKPPTTSDNVRGTAFRWHVDSEYMKEEWRENPYITCWIALDDMSKGTGTLYIDGYPADESISTENYSYNDLHSPKRYEDPRFPVRAKQVVNVPAGSIVLMSSFVRHCSFPNLSSQRYRRVYMPQFICLEDNGKTAFADLKRLCVPCCRQ